MNKNLGWGAVFGLLAAPLTASAALVTYEFSTNLAPEFIYGATREEFCPDNNCPITGTIVFDSEAVGTSSQVVDEYGVRYTASRYDSALVAFQITYWTGTTISRQLGPGESYVSASRDRVGQFDPDYTVDFYCVSAGAGPAAPNPLFDICFEGSSFPGGNINPTELSELLTIFDWSAAFTVPWPWTFYFAGDISALYFSGGPGEQYFRQVQVPEPGTLTLLALGLVGMGYSRRRKAS